MFIYIFMAEKFIPTYGAVLYRLAFLLFIAACLFNAYDAFTTYTQAKYSLIGGVNADEKLNESVAFLGLSVILTLECVGLMMYKWARRQIGQAVEA